MSSKKRIAQILGFSGFPTAYSLLRTYFKKYHIYILCYHRVTDKKDDWSLPAISPYVFNKQMQYLKKWSQVLPLSQLVALLSKESQELYKKRYAAITFDDGYKDNYQFAYPILKKYKLPATIFLTAGYIGKDELFWWDKVSYVLHRSKELSITVPGWEPINLNRDNNRNGLIRHIIERMKTLDESDKIELLKKILSEAKVEIPSKVSKDIILNWHETREMAKNGIEFGAHGCSHSILTNLPLSDVEEEVSLSKEIIENELNRKVYSFAYPNGNYNENILNIMKSNGFHCAVTTENGFVTPKSNPFKLPRIGASNDYNIFKILLSGVLNDISYH